MSSSTGTAKPVRPGGGCEATVKRCASGIHGPDRSHCYSRGVSSQASDPGLMSTAANISGDQAALTAACSRQWLETM